MPLQPPPTFENLLLEQPWPLVLALVAAAGVLFWLGRQRSEKRMKVIAGAAIVMAGVVLALASFVTTNREHLRARTQDLIALTAPFNAPEVRSYFDDRALLTGPGGEAWFNITQLMEKVHSVVHHYSITGHSIHELQAASKSGGDDGQSYARLRTMVAGRPMDTEWLITWKRGSDGVWRVVIVQWLTINNEQPGRAGI